LFLQLLAQAINKQIDELHEKTEMAEIELETFRRLRDHEQLAVPKRIGTLTDEVRRQEERERELQKRYDTLRREAQLLVEHERREQASISVEPVSYMTIESDQQKMD
jgi:pre-mRNA-splicing factor CDC5/CEF1